MTSSVPMTVSADQFNFLSAESVARLLDAVLGAGWQVTATADCCTARKVALRRHGGHVGKLYSASSLAELMWSIRADHPGFDLRVARATAALRSRHVAR